jgi:hypothetical protein
MPQPNSILLETLILTVNSNLLNAPFRIVSSHFNYKMFIR